MCVSVCVHVSGSIQNTIANTHASWSYLAQFFLFLSESNIIFMFLLFIFPSCRGRTTFPILIDLMAMCGDGIVLLKQFTCGFIRCEMRHLSSVWAIKSNTFNTLKELLNRQSIQKLISFQTIQFNWEFIKVHCTHFANRSNWKWDNFQSKWMHTLHTHTQRERKIQMSIPMWLQVCKIKLKYIRWYTFDLIKQLI